MLVRGRCDLGTKKSHHFGGMYPGEGVPVQPEPRLAVQNCEVHLWTAFSYCDPFGESICKLREESGAGRPRQGRDLDLLALGYDSHDG
jgi:hypothetical protein